MQKKILIVDDERIIRESLCSDLKRAGYEADAVSSGEEALLLLTQNSYGAIISDLRMGGIELLSKTKEQDPVMPVIIITGYGELATAVAAMRLGAADYLLKPYDNDELLIRIRNCLEKRELLEKISVYENILSICCECRKIRDDSSYLPENADWLTLEQYLNRKTSVRLNHGYCSECSEKTMAELNRTLGKDPDSSTVAGTVQPGRVIVVDDEPDICEYIKILLQEQHYEVSVASTAEEALACLDKQDFDVLVTDIRMPGMSGITLTQKARRISTSLQCIVITGHGDIDSAVMALRMGAVGYLQKPLDFAELEAQVALALEKSRLIKQVERHYQQLKQLVEERTLALKGANQQLLHEITIRKEAEKKAYHQATHDYLTGLPNRLLLEDRFQTMVASAQRHTSKFTVMMLDLDGFKLVNDTHGHEMGDRVLQTVASRLCGLLRESDTIVRMGGDEFLLLLPDIANQSSAINVAKKVREAIATPMNQRQHEIHISISIGIAIFPDDGELPDMLIKKADQEMYRMKQVKNGSAT